MGDVAESLPAVGRPRCSLYLYDTAWFSLVSGSPWQWGGGRNAANALLFTHFLWAAASACKWEVQLVSCSAFGLCVCFSGGSRTGQIKLKKIEQVTWRCWASPQVCLYILYFVQVFYRGRKEELRHRALPLL